MATAGKSKKSKSRPVTTTAISQPVVEDLSTQTVLSCFSPSSKYLAYVSLAVDKHRLRIYDAVAGQSVAEYTPLSARVSALSWGQVSASARDTSPSRKKRRKSVQPSADELVLLGLSDGSTVLISPKHGRALYTLTHSSCSASILAITSTADTLWTSSADGNVYLWNIHARELIGTWKTDDRIPYTSLALHSTDTSILAAHHSIRLLQVISDPDPQNPVELASFTGHVSSIKQLRWDSSNPRFFSMAEGDRVISLWEVPDSGKEGKMVASVQLDSDARSISLDSSSSEQQALLALAASGKVSICPIPSELIPPASARAQHKISALPPRSVALQKGGNPAQLIAASFIPNRYGAVRIARVVAGIRPVFDDIQYLDDNGQYISNIDIEPVKANIVADSKLAAPNKRYSEPSSVAVGSGVQLGQHENMDGVVEQTVEGELDVNIAELSLGQRLAAVSGEEPHLNDSDEGDPTPGGRKRDSRSIPAAIGSLSRTLIQALHSSDSKLLETCLAHSDESLIKNTIKRLPPQLTMPLIIACMERLGRGARGGNLKGGGAGASSQRGATLIAWIKTTLTVHSGHLMTMPDLVARLSGLHATLTTRIALQESLLSLSGRLDMVLSQIELRSSAAPAPVTLKKGKPISSTTSAVVNRYVEGESEEDIPNDVEVEMEDIEDEASVEDVEFAGDSSDESETSDEEEGSGDEDDDDYEINGFIDDEAEEYSEEDEEEEDSE